MACCVILDIDVRDPGRYEAYKKLSGPALEAHGGRFLVRGGAHEVVEGDWRPNRVVVLQFDSKQQAMSWYRSPEYVEAMKIRHEAADSRMILVEGA